MNKMFELLFAKLGKEKLAEKLIVGEPLDPKTVRLSRLVSNQYPQCEKLHQPCKVDCLCWNEAQTYIQSKVAA
mgnify:CR=1 FL=1|jgi:hypothetical protein